MSSFPTLPYEARTRLEKGVYTIDVHIPGVPHECVNVSVRRSDPLYSAICAEVNGEVYLVTSIGNEYDAGTLQASLDLGVLSISMLDPYQDIRYIPLGTKRGL